MRKTATLTNGSNVQQKKVPHAVVPAAPEDGTLNVDPKDGSDMVFKF